jgi:hypothetical protein
MNISVFLLGNHFGILTNDNIEKFAKDSEGHSSFGLLIHITSNNGFKFEINLQPFDKPYAYWMKLCNGEDKCCLELEYGFDFEINGDNIKYSNHGDCFTIPISSGILNLIKEKIDLAHAHGLIED